ncbi:MAG: nucleoside hydrolase [Synechococcales bacterium]|nr:nucleoside hydrolase [Synechococcales bacterium]
MDATTKPIPLILDDDGSQDGMTAWAFMLANPQFDVKAITIAQGIARPEVFVDNVDRMLGRLGVTGIPVGVGRPDPLEGDNAFPEFIREGSDTFWAPFVTLPATGSGIEVRPAAELIVETIKNSPEPVAILATGTMTNIAEALRLDPSIIDNIKVIEILGGAVFVPGNLPVLPFPPFSTNTTAEFNIWVDPVAAQEVFDAGELGLNIQLTPLDATGQIEFSRDDYKAWLATGTPESLLSAEFLDFALTIIQSDNDPNPVWDLVAAINLSEAAFSPKTPLRIEVDTESDPGATQGQTTAVPGVPNVLATLDPSFDNLAFSASSLFQYLDVLSYLPHEQVQTGTPDADTLFGTHLEDLISGLNGNDTIFGNGGGDTLLGGGGNDQLFGSASADFLDGASGNDTLYGNGGNDTLIGGTGDDLIFGGGDSDIILGGAGNDTIYGNGGNDAIDSGNGMDIVWLGSGEATVTLNEGEGFVTVNNFQVGASRFAVGSLLEQLTFTDSGAGVQIVAGGDVLAVVNNLTANTLAANAGQVFV